MKRSWLDNVSGEIYTRLTNCRSEKSDILPLAQARWTFLKEHGLAKVFQKEDALITVLELLDSNNQSVLSDLTKDEYNEILGEII